VPKVDKKSAPRSPQSAIVLRGCRQHNLQGFDLEIPLGKLTVVTGPSGSGKSSLAFHTLYAEGQRRYVETFSPYVRQFFDRMDKPAVDHIEGIPPAIAIEQKNHVRTTRSTVGTLTEINDYLKLLFARLGIGYDPKTGEAIQPDSPESAAAWALENLAEQSALVTFPITVPENSNSADILPFLNAQGYLRILIGGEIHRTDEPLQSAIKPSAISVVQDRLTITAANHSRLLEALEAAFTLGKGHAAVILPSSFNVARSMFDVQRAFSTTWTNPATGFTLRPPTPALFSFNSPLGACPKCRGFGRVIGIDIEKAIPDKTLSIAQGAIKPFQGERGDECQRDLVRNCKERGIDTKCPIEDLSEDEQEWIYYGDRKTDDLTPDELESLWQSGSWYGVKGFFDWMESKAYKMHVRVFLSRYRSYTSCNSCRGKRLQPESLCFKVNGKTLPELWALSISDLLPWFSSLITDHRSLGASLDLVLTEINSRLNYLDQVGLGYLTLDRATRTLSGGEVERVNLTTCLGAALTGTLFVLDEPTVGLHPRDIDRLVGVMHGLRDKGNTLVVVEHEQTVMQAADHLVDIGPGAGTFGGTLIYQGKVPSFQSSVFSEEEDRRIKRGPSSLKAENLKLATSAGTLPWLNGTKFIAIPKKRRKPTKEKIQIKGATRHNLKKLDVEIPLGLFTALTGVSGSGKSTFAHDVLYLNLARKLGQEVDGDAAPIKDLRGSQYLSGVELIDQTAVARTPRSTPAVFLGAFDPIRQLFCETDAGKSAGLKPGFFSFNSGEGRCDRCAGNGFEKVEMQFLSDLYVTCPDCKGKRYKSSTLDYTYNDHSISDVLDLTVADVAAVFNRQDHHSKKEERLIQQILTALDPLLQVGLGYLKLGQPLNTLSGGEAQRLKLCQLLSSSLPENSKLKTKKLLILDEPTTGLHFSDIENLLTVFQKLVDSGHSLLVIEHNLDVIKSADWIIDLGPEAGKHGGQLVAQGPPEEVAQQNTPTAHFLKQALGSASLSPANSGILPKSLPPQSNAISLKGARHHNLKNISVEIPRDQLVVISGLSGSGKSTLAFDILFAEGQRRFLDSMSAYARQFAEQLEKPEIDQLSGLPPTVAIEQRVSQGNGKSTIATVTELWNFIRLLYSKIGTLYCPDCKVPVAKQSLSAIENTIRDHLKKGDVTLLAPIIRGKKGYHTEIAEWALKQGFTKLLVDKQFKDAEGFTRLERFKEHDIDIVVAEVPSDQSSVIRGKSKKNSPLKTENLNLANSIAKSLEIGKGLLKIFTPDKKFILLSTKSSCPSCNQSFEELDPRLFSFNSPHGWCTECRGHGRVPKRRQYLDTARFDSVLEAELDADRAIERMEDVELAECPVCNGSRLNSTASAVRLHTSGWNVPLQPVKGESRSASIAEIAHLSIRDAAEHFKSISFNEDRESLIARDILPEIRQRLTFLQEVGLGYLQLDRSGNTLSGGESQRIRLAAQLGSNLRGVLYVLDEPTIGLHPRDNAALLKTLIALRDQGNSLVIVEHDEDTIAAADHLIDLGPGAGRLGGEIVYQGKPPEVASFQFSVSRKEKKSVSKVSSLNTENSKLANSPTYRALSAVVSHPIRGNRRSIAKDHPLLTISNCHANNLKNIDVAIPLGRLTVLTGISGSGKSSLMHSCVAAVFNRQAKSKYPFGKVTGEKQIKACYEVDQSPIGKTSRSCPATYVKVFDHIRALFAQLPEARMRGFDASRFSFNTDGGRCPECKGNGRVKLEMDFLPSSWVHCESCNGERYNPATLEVTFRQKNIGQVLAMTIDEASTFFESQPRISHPLKLMADTGLGYLQLGQPSPTLSGGEAQRIKLVSELVKGRGTKATLNNAALTQRNIYLIEEPTVGLHLEDVHRLIDVLHRLVDEGHTVVVIEHHMAVAAEADWILDIGPEAGEGGGKIIAEGPPEKIVKSKVSRTAPFLAVALKC
jgi:excinuclease ABC subunit A